jgi:hypothetical protein
MLVFHAYVKEIHGSRSKIPSKKILSGSVAQRDLIPALRVKVVYYMCKCGMVCVQSAQGDIHQVSNQHVWMMSIV